MFRFQVRTCLALTFCCLWAGPLFADEQSEGLALIEKASKAVGEADKQAKLTNISWKAAGKIETDELSVELSVVGWTQALDKHRLDISAVIGGNRVQLLIVSAATQGWIKANAGNTSELPKEIVTLMHHDLYALKLAQQVSLLKDKAYRLSPLGEVSINDKAALGVRVAQKDKPDVNLFFDKSTHLPVKCEVTVKEPEGAGEITHAFLLSEHKELAGVKHFTKLVLLRGEKKAMELEFSEVTAVEPIEKEQFAKP